MAFSYSPKIITDGLVLYLDAGNPLSYPGSGTTWTDLSRGQNPGTLTNGPTFDSGNGGSIVFDGTDDYITGLDNISINTGLPFTVEFWSNITQYSDPFPTIIQLKTNTTYGWNLSFNISTGVGGAYYGVLFGSSDTWARIRTNNPPATEFWYNVAVAYNGSGASTISNYNVYLNSSLQTLYSTGGFNNTTQDNYIGTTNAASRGIDDFRGKISSVRVYNKALSQPEITQNYNATKTRFGLT